MFPGESMQWLVDDNPRSSAVRGLLTALAVTPILLLSSNVREIVSPQATMIVLGFGILLGIVTSYSMDRMLLWDDRFDATAIGILIAFGGGLLFFFIGIVNLALGSREVSFLIHFALSFIWSMALMSVVRQFVMPNMNIIYADK